MRETITRRGFMKGAALAASAAAATALTACDGEEAPATNEDGTVKKILRLGQSNAKVGLDMQKSTNSGSASIVDCIFEAPLRWTEDNELVPCLLTETPPRSRTTASPCTAPSRRASSATTAPR